MVAIVSQRFSGRKWLLWAPRLAALSVLLCSGAVALREGPMVRSRDGVIRAPKLGGDWRCGDFAGAVTARAGAAPLAVSLVRCESARNPGLALLAKVYRVAPEEIRPPDVLLRDVYRRQYDRLFRDLSVEYGPARAWRALSGSVVRLRGRVIATGEPVELEERVFVVDSSVLLLSVIGPPERVAAARPQVLRFLAETQLHPWRLAFDGPGA